MAVFRKINVGRVATSVEIMGQDDGTGKIHWRAWWKQWCQYNGGSGSHMDRAEIIPRVEAHRWKALDAGVR